MKIFISPIYNSQKNSSGNLYLKLFTEAFQKDGKWEIANKYPNAGILSIFCNLDAEVYVFHWVEAIILRNYGKMQVVFFVLALLFLKLRKKKVIWFLHNKKAHNTKSKSVDFLMSFMAKEADMVITHSQEGVLYFEKLFPQRKQVCHYIPHPVYNKQIFNSDSKELCWDYIIWGGIERRKNVSDFVKYVRDNSFFREKKILICGKCGDIEYDKEILNNLDSNVTYINKFLDDFELASYLKKSRTILFTYNPDSILSSGALIYSLNFCKPIIGPKVGVFKEMPKVVSCFESFSDIPLLMPSVDVSFIKYYISQNQWDDIPHKIEELLK